MFTGIIQDIGEIASVEKNGDWIVAIKTDKLPLDKTELGASISCNGVCLTVIEKSAKQFKVQISQETLSKTTALHWQPGRRINLEPALRAGEELGGHYVSGHVDGIAKLANRNGEGNSERFRFEIPAPFAKYLTPKGSVTIDGVSLTVNEVDGNGFNVNIIPHTLKMTVLGALMPGADANFEVDMIARYVERMLNAKAAS